jgi:hypothetical protein
MTIRPAALDDLDRLLALGREMHVESSYRSLNFDEQKARMFLMRLMSDQYVRVYEQDDKILGGMVGMSVQPWFSNDLYAVDIALFISAKHRGSLAAARLIKDFCCLGKTNRGKTNSARRYYWCARHGRVASLSGDGVHQLWINFLFECEVNCYVYWSRINSPLYCNRNCLRRN